MLQSARGLHFIRRGTVVERNVVSLLVKRPFEVAVKARQHVSCSTVWITGFVRSKVVYCHIQSIDLRKQQLSNSCLVCLLCWSSLTHFLSTPHVLSGLPMTLPFGAKFDLLISFEFQAKASQHLKVPLSDSFSNRLDMCWQPERVGSHHLGVSF